MLTQLPQEALVRYQDPKMACNLMSSFCLVAFLGTTSWLRLGDRDGYFS